MKGRILNSAHASLRFIDLPSLVRFSLLTLLVPPKYLMASILHRILEFTALVPRTRAELHSTDAVELVPTISTSGVYSRRCIAAYNTRLFYRFSVLRPPVGAIQRRWD
jgi:hypothetical protein